MTKRQADLFPGLQSSKKYVSDYPLLVLEWHPTKNGDKHPDDYLHGSHKKYGGNVRNPMNGKQL